MGVSLDGVKPELRRRIEGMLADGPALSVSSAFRTKQQQQERYELFLAGKGPPANRPGTSRHETGDAVDVETGPGNFALRAALAHKWALKVPHKDELWHMELDPTRQPLGDDDMLHPDSKIDAILAPNGGVWTLTYDGGVRATRGAPFYGSYPGLPPEARKGVRNFIAIVPEGDGYTIISDENEASTYHFDSTTGYV